MLACSSGPSSGFGFLVLAGAVDVFGSRLAILRASTVSGRARRATLVKKRRTHSRRAKSVSLEATSRVAAKGTVFPAGRARKAGPRRMAWTNAKNVSGGRRRTMRAARVYRGPWARSGAQRRGSARCARWDSSTPTPRHRASIAQRAGSPAQRRRVNRVRSGNGRTATAVAACRAISERSASAARAGAKAAEVERWRIRHSPPANHAPSANSPQRVL